MFRILKKDHSTRARAGILETPHGAVETPAYVVVGTHAKVRTLDAADAKKIGTQLIIANTYHLWQTLGEDGLKKFPGLHAAMGWHGPLMTDSGGFQVFSMGAAREHGAGKVARAKQPADGRGFNLGQSAGENRTEKELEHVRKPSFAAKSQDCGREALAEAEPYRGIRRGRAVGLYSRNPAIAAEYGVSEHALVKITEDGVVFINNGVRQWLDAEKSIRIQQQLGADIIFAFDEPTSPVHDYAYTAVSLMRTHRWAERSLKAKASSQMLYGIVQGGPYEDLRKESARLIGEMPFDGIAIGGSYSNSFGDTREQTIREISWAVPFLPEDKPRHLLGIGLVPDIFAGVAAGMDTFDCVVPTREARHGSLWVGTGRRIDITKGRYRDDKSIIDQHCSCVVCAEMKIEKCALHALFKAKNPEAGRLATLHNVSFFNLLMSRIRGAIKEGKLAQIKEEFIAVKAT